MRWILGLTIVLAGCPSPEGEVDADNDGFVASEDCDDSNPNVNPDRPETCGNNIDDNCDDIVDDNGTGAAIFYVDADSDTYGSDADTVTACAAPDGYVQNNDDCDDTDGDIRPGVADNTCDGVDNDCSGVADQDAPGETFYRDEDDDGYGSDESLTACFAPDGYVDNDDDCDDDRGEAYPGAAELCNELDDDCDTVPDNGISGAGPLCAAESCKAILAEQPSAPNGNYWVMLNEPYELECEMQGPGTQGWTVLTGQVLKEQKLVEFELLEGAAGAWSAGWFASGEYGFDISPRRTLDRMECDTTVSEASVVLPFRFDRWKGEFDVTYWGNDNVDDDRMILTCDQGGFRFAATSSFIKVGGTWGTLFEEVRTVSWADTETLAATREFSWLLNGYQATGALAPGDEYVQVRDIRIAVH